MRQAGVLAAAGRHALAHNRAALAEDHRRAEALAEALTALGAGEVQQATNMVFFTPGKDGTAPLRDALAARGILIGGQSPTVRIVLHRDVDDAGLAHAIAAFRAHYGS